MSARVRWRLLALITAALAGMVSAPVSSMAVSPKPSSSAATASAGQQIPVAASGRPSVSGAFGSVAPFRVLDTRYGTGAARAAVGANSSVAVKVSGVGGVPAAGVSAVVVNLTVTQPSARGYLTSYADGAARPNASALDFVRGQTVANLAVVPVGADGKIRLSSTSSGTVQLIADITGYYLVGNPDTTEQGDWATDSGPLGGNANPYETHLTRGNVNRLAFVWNRLGPQLYSAYVVAAGLVIATTESPYEYIGVAAYDATNGKLVWNHPDITPDGLAADGDKVFFQGSYGPLVDARPRYVVGAFDLRSGALLWFTPYGAEPSYGPSITAANGRVFASFLDTTMQAFSETDGHHLWESHAAPYMATIIAADGWVLTHQSSQGHLLPIGLDPATGRVIWKGNFVGGVNLGVMNGNIVDAFVDGGSTDTYVSSWPMRPCPDGCDPTWTDTIPYLVSVSGGNGIIAASTARPRVGVRVGQLIVLDPATGHRRWTATTSDDALNLTVAGTVIYAITHYVGDTLLAWPTSGCGSPTCPPIWKTSSLGTATTGRSQAIVVTQGRLYYARDRGSDDPGGIYSWALSK